MLLFVGVLVSYSLACVGHSKKKGHEQQCADLPVNQRPPISEYNLSRNLQRLTTAAKDTLQEQKGQ